VNYKDHRIEVTVRAIDDYNDWRTDILVTYSEHGKAVLQCPRMDQTFANPKEAEEAGVEFAQKWIDDGKPDLLNYDA
jgi:hypothetical protein